MDTNLPMPEDKLISELINETDPEKLKRITDLFNINQAKKDILRLQKYNELIDDLTKEMCDRVNRKPGEFSNKDLIDYLNAANGSIDRAKKSFAAVDSAPSIQINQVNIDSTPEPLPRESREKVTQAIMSILNKVKIDEPLDLTDTSKLLEEEEN